VNNSKMLTGKIVRRVVERGFGFIQLDKSKKEYFYHMSGCKEGAEGYEMMIEGTPVIFEEEIGNKGPRAKNVTLAPDEATS